MGGISHLRTFTYAEESLKFSSINVAVGSRGSARWAEVVHNSSGRLYCTSENEAWHNASNQPIKSFTMRIIQACLLLYFLPPFSAFTPEFISRCHGRNTALFAGDGVAPTYRWHEEAFEIEVTVAVPPGTRAKDIVFEATSRSIDLRLKTSEGTVVLLDPARKLRGRVSLDGTFWVISDGDNGSREVTVTIEKLIRTPSDDFQVVEYDWKGVYSNDTEVSYRKYDEPETLNVREYAASLGVDIDNINMSMVDKTMFTSGLNLTQSSLDELSKAGLVREVTQQADGSEYITDDDGEAQQFSPYGQNVKPSERPKVPFLDTNSPWHTAVPVQVDKETNRTYVQQTRNFTRAAFAEDASVKEERKTTKTATDAKDPIDMLTVTRLKEILKSQGLKVTGSKKELQDRLRKQVNSMLQGKQGTD